MRETRYYRVSGSFYKCLKIGVMKILQGKDVLYFGRSGGHCERGKCGDL
jgi:hypothetical protein